MTESATTAGPSAPTAVAAPVSPAPARRSAARPSGALARHAEAEYLYVSRDLRHIGYVFGAVLVIMVVLWLAIDFLHLIRY